LAVSGNFKYRKRKTFFELALDDNNTYQGDSLSSSKSDISFAWQRSLKKSWSTELSVGASQNTELGTKLRLDFNVIGIKDISYNVWNRFYTGAGISVARETPYDGSTEKADLAGLVQVVWKVYKFNVPKIWVDANVSYLPYITESSRYRAVINLSPRISVLSDNFKIGINSYYNFDSKPPSGASSTSDYGINLELTYSFH